MRLEDLTVALRPRSAWEAIELGTALVRRHARAVWRPWLACTLPVFAVVNALCAAVGHPALAMVLMWWLKPLFDRIPLFVLSRAVFGEVPGTRATLRGAFRGGGRAMLGYLLWRRLSPARALLMPVDVLEGGDPSRARARRRVLAGPAYGVASLCLLVFANFELALVLGLALLAFVFVPNEYLQASFLFAWQRVQDAPSWLQLVENTIAWAAVCVLEPFYVGSGFGQYLNRRTEIEGWDIELVFRRLRARLQAAAGVGLVVLALLLAPRPSLAAGMAQCPRPSQDDTTVLHRAFGADYRDPARFSDAVDRAYADPRLHPQRKTTGWRLKHPPKIDRRDRALPDWLKGIGALFGTLGEAVMWGLLAALVLLVVATARHWWPWLRGIATDPAAPPSPVDERVVAEPEPLPDDVPGTVRRLWAEGRAREALALLYRAAVEALPAATGRALPPGATEAQCLRAAQALPDAMRRAFARVVRLWQLAAYADRLPASDEFDAALDDVVRTFGWRA